MHGPYNIKFESNIILYTSICSAMTPYSFVWAPRFQRHVLLPYQVSPKPVSYLQEKEWTGRPDYPTWCPLPTIHLQYMEQMSLIKS
jgi:hypothetical protein